MSAGTSTPPQFSCRQRDALLGILINHPAPHRNRVGLTVLMFWSLVLELFGRPRLDYGITILFVAALGIQNGLLGALLAFAGHPFLSRAPPHGSRPASSM